MDPKGEQDYPLGLPGIPGAILEGIMRPRRPAYCTLPQGVPFTGPLPLSKDERCRKEWEEAERICTELLAHPDPPRRLTGGHRNLYDCMKGFVSEECGGNPVDRGRQGKRR